MRAPTRGKLAGAVGCDAALPNCFRHRCSTGLSVLLSPARAALAVLGDSLRERACVSRPGSVHKGQGSLKSHRPVRVCARHCLGRVPGPTTRRSCETTPHRCPRPWPSRGAQGAANGEGAAGLKPCPCVTAPRTAASLGYTTGSNC